MILKQNNNLMMNLILKKECF